MNNAFSPADPIRVDALRSLDILDTEAEKDFDDIVMLASRICGTPISLVSLIDENRQWFKANHGLDGVTETPRDIAFCSHAIEQDDLMIVTDATRDSRFADNPLVTGSPDIRFYAGMPLVTSAGFKIGTLCVIDRLPRHLDDEQRDSLRILSSQVMKLIELRQHVNQLRIAQQELRTAKDKAEQATASKSQFLSTMSHEIRTPMNAVIGLTEILLQRSPREDQAHDLRLLKFSGENLLTIINDILDFNKIEAGKMDLETISFDLHDLVANCRSLNEKKCIEKGIGLSTYVAPGVPKFVSGDLVRLNQILTNLVGNAVKFTEKGGVEVCVAAKKVAGGFNVHFRIKDTGIGIPEDKLGHIFDQFTQANSDTTRKYGGTGLGLAITKKLIELMGGSISIESTVGLGSVFSFELTMQEGRELASPDRVGTSGAGSVLRGKILLVEDNKVNQIVANNFLSKWGLQVDFANDGAQALALIDNRSYDVVLMDLQMPEMDGFTAAASLRSREDVYFKTVPIIALTASAMAEVREQVFASGMNDYVSKPFDASELRAKIIKYLPGMNQDHKRSSHLREKLDSFGEYRAELSQLIAGEISELTEAARRLDPKNPESFLTAFHKTKTSVGMLEDTPYATILSAIDTCLQNDDTADLPRLINSLTRASEELIGELNAIQR